MLTPKYEIGEIFYFASSWRPGPAVFTYCPTVVVITGVIIERKEISYKTKKLIYKDDGTDTTEEPTIPEKDFELMFKSINDTVTAISRVLENGFQKLNKKVNKERLKEVLNV